MPRRSSASTSLRSTSFSAAGRRDAHPEDGSAITQPRKDHAGIGAETQCLLDRQRRAGTLQVLSHDGRGAIDRVGAGILLAFQREQFFVAGIADARRGRGHGDQRPDGRAGMKLKDTVIFHPNQILRRKASDECLHLRGVMRQRRASHPDPGTAGRRRRPRRANVHVNSGAALPSAAMSALAAGDLFQGARNAGNLGHQLGLLDLGEVDDLEDYQGGAAPAGARDSWRA